ncbi:carbonic anhydrase [Chloroflexia bacterium SDU3-3]|nr:carbonic anhydrase [Chloroflexia bacterium SDU3-3]
MKNPAPRARRAFLRVSGIAAVGTLATACGSATAAVPTAAPQPTEAPVSSPDEALARLVEGNKRFVANTPTNINHSPERRAALASGQAPFATVLSCVDSRVPPEIIFDRGLGDLFTIRTAGHVLDHAVIGSLEFGVAELKIPLLVVMGHEKCGAVKATIETLEKHGKAEDDIETLVLGIEAAVEAAKAKGGGLLDTAVHENTVLTVQKLKELPIFASAIQEQKLKIVGARYDLDTGAVVLIEA